MRYSPFRMERYQSTYEHRVRYNLSESGVHPLTVGELLEIAESDVSVDDIRLGYGQSNGSDGLRELIASQYQGATAASVLVTVGGAEANFTCFWHLFETEGSAALVLPTYGQVPGLLESFGSRLAAVNLIEENRWQPDLDALERALADGARFVLVTNPNNPTGVALTRESMDAIAELVGRRLDPANDEAVVDGQPEPHVVERLAGLDLAPVFVFERIGLGVDDTGFDIEQAVLAAIASAFDGPV